MFEVALCCNLLQETQVSLMCMFLIPGEERNAARAISRSQKGTGIAIMTQFASLGRMARCH